MIALTGGKTGGHIMPLIQIAKNLNECIYIGAKNSLEEKICSKKQVDFQGLEIKREIFSLLKNSFSLKLDNIDAIISTGGYVSIPLILYGIRKKIPIYLLEENVILGHTNRFFSFFSKKVFLTYPLAKMKKKYEVVGLPVDVNISNNNSYEECDILIIGGSLGSEPLCDLASILAKKFKVCLVAGRFYEKYEDRTNLKVYTYLDDLPDLMAKAKLVISRAGASTTYELFSLNRPCIIIPSMNTKQNHQYLNAVFFKNQGCAEMVLEKDAKSNICDACSRLLNNEQRIINMQEKQRKLVNKTATEKIIKIVRNDKRK